MEIWVAVLIAVGSLALATGIIAAGVWCLRPDDAGTKRSRNADPLLQHLHDSQRRAAAAASDPASAAAAAAGSAATRAALNQLHRQKRQSTGLVYGVDENQPDDSYVPTNAVRHLPVHFDSVPYTRLGKEHPVDFLHEEAFMLRVPDLAYAGADGHPTTFRRENYVPYEARPDLLPGGIVEDEQGQKFVSEMKFDGEKIDVMQDAHHGYNANLMHAGSPEVPSKYLKRMNHLPGLGSHAASEVPDAVAAAPLMAQGAVLVKDLVRVDYKESPHSRRLKLDGLGQRDLAYLPSDPDELPPLQTLGLSNDLDHVPMHDWQGTRRNASAHLWRRPGTNVGRRAAGFDVVHDEDQDVTAVEQALHEMDDRNAAEGREYGTLLPPLPDHHPKPIRSLMQ